MAITIRRAKREDFPALFALIEGLAAYEKLPPPDADAKARMLKHGWPENGDPPKFKAWLAEEETEEKQAVGYAITFETYSTFLAQPTLYLEDLFVLPECRGRATGTALIHRLIQEAIDTDCGRMEWVVLDWNTRAQTFYQKLGARHLTEWHSYRLLRDNMPAALKNS